MTTSVHDAIVDLLIKEGVVFRQVSHAPTFTSEESAQARGEPVKVGGKALVVKVGDEFKLFVLSAALRFDSGAVKKHFGVKKVRFAEREELERLTGLAPGSVPPLGEPILPLKLYVDPSVLANDRIAFNAGSLTNSVVMPVADYMRIAKPEVLSFAVEGTA
jgi:Ala-tRNA(Pro) deacylase